MKWHLCLSNQSLNAQVYTAVNISISHKSKSSSPKSWMLNKFDAACGFVNMDLFSEQPTTIESAVFSLSFVLHTFGHLSVWSFVYFTQSPELETTLPRLRIPVSLSLLSENLFTNWFHFDCP